MGKRFSVLFGVALVAVCMGILLIRAFTGASHTTLPTGSKVKYTSPSRVWSVEFPKEPEYTTSIFRDDIGLPTVSLEGATADVQEAVYLVRVYRYHDRKTPDLKEFQAEVLKAWQKKFPTLKLLSSEPSTFKDQPSLAFTLMGQNLEIKAIAFSEDDNVYLIGLIGNTELFDAKGEEDFKKFLDTFEVLQNSL